MAKVFYAVIRSSDDSTEVSIAKVQPLRTQTRSDFEEAWEELKGKDTKSVSVLCTEMEQKGFEIELVEENPAVCEYSNTADDEDEDDEEPEDDGDEFDGEDD